MEDFLVARLCEKWKNNSDLLGYIHDGDTKTKKYWKINHNIDELPKFHD